MPIRTNRPGTPSPDRWIVHESLVDDNKKIEGVGGLHAGATCANTVPLASLVTCAGASRGRVRFRATVGGQLELVFCRPGGGSAPELYAAGNPAPVTVTANVETLLSTDAISGEALALIRFTPSGAGTINFCDWMAL
jgi:hypothetical protein